MQALLTFKARCFGGPISQVEVLKVGTQDGDPKPLAAQGEAGSCQFLPSCVSLNQGWGWCGSISAFPTHFPVSCFLICPVYGNHSGSRFCSQEIVSYVAIDLVCPHRRWVQDLPSDYPEQETSGLLFVLNFKKNLIPVLLMLFESLKEMEIVPVHSTTWSPTWQE